MLEPSLRRVLLPQARRLLCVAERLWCGLPSSFPLDCMSNVVGGWSEVTAERTVWGVASLRRRRACGQAPGKGRFRLPLPSCCTTPASLVMREAWVQAGLRKDAGILLTIPRRLVR
jgi:hypothetical protein